MSIIPIAAEGAAEGARQDRLPQSDALTATEQAIQLDELIEWIRLQAAVPGGEPETAQAVRPGGN